MKALLYTAPGAYSVTDVPTPEPRGSEVLIRVRACGVCKTDVHIHHGHFISAFPLIPGHEFAGEVAAVGDAVTQVQVGDRVVADNERQCGHCHYCRRGEPLFCENLYAQGVNAPGGFAEYVLVEEQQVYALDDGISFLEGALVEPTACAVHGMDVIRPQTGDEVLQFGAGPTGLIIAQLFYHGGAAALTMVDLVPAKLELAARWAHAETLQVHPEDPEAHIRLLHERHPRGFNIVLDATGVSRVIAGLTQFADYGAKVVCYGVAGEEERIEISPYEVFRRELKILGSFSQAHTFDRAVRLVNSGVVQLKEMVTHTFPLEGWGEALATVISGRESIKVVITP
ncbi:MAG TPA: zinc-dependent alcohol dehydrogenase family protein [Armatimonadota bacterium]|jgi:D-arabinitol dehydrogenase (NADP+)